MEKGQRVRCKTLIRTESMRNCLQSSRNTSRKEFAKGVAVILGRNSRTGRKASSSNGSTSR
eukprot:6012092-Pyramimonas_sp.AAC.1